MKPRKPARKEPKKQKKPLGPRFDAAVHVERAHGLGLMGYIDTEIAAALGISDSTFYAWKAKHSDFSEAIKSAREPIDIEAVQSLRTRMNGGVFEEQQAIKIKTSDGEDVKVVTVSKYVPPDTTALIYWLNNRRRDKWKNYKAVEHSAPGGGPIQHQIATTEGVVAALKELREILK